MDGFEIFYTIHYETPEMHKKEKLCKRIFRSRAFKVFLSLSALSVFIFIAFVIYNDITVRGVDYRNQEFADLYEQREFFEPENGITDNQGGKININTATADELMALPEVGVARASAIIEHREENGWFRSAEEIMNVKNINEKTYFIIKDFITVN